MDDLKGMQIDGGLDDLANDEGRDILRQPLPPLHVLVQIIAVDILGNYIDVRLAADGLLVLDYLRMRNDLHDLALIVKSSDGLTCQFLSADVLEGVGPA